MTNFGHPGISQSEPKPRQPDLVIDFDTSASTLTPQPPQMQELDQVGGRQ